jgi:alkaline phosphatase
MNIGNIGKVVIFKFSAHLLATAIAVVVIMGQVGCSVSEIARGRGAQLQGRAAHVIQIVGDGMQLEHERAFNNYLTGSYNRGLKHWDFPYQGAATTWDVTTYNRFASEIGAKPITDPDFDPQVISSFTATIGYDPAKGGKQPYPRDSTATVNSLAALDYYGIARKVGGAADGKSPATDSASAGTALATGFKTDDGNIAWRPGDTASGGLKTIAELYRKQRQAAIGVISTVPFSHATPAAFVSHNVDRDNYAAIAREIINAVSPEVVIGGGHPAFNDPAGIAGPKAFKYIGQAEYAQLKNSTDYVFAERALGVDGGSLLLAKAGDAASSRKKLFGLFGGAGGSFEYHAVSDDGSSDIIRGSGKNPTLAQASTAALDVLRQNVNGFFLLIEQGDIDWANHLNDYKSMIGGMWDLNQAVKAVETYIDRPGDNLDWTNTLVIVTSDHGNSFMRINPARPLTKGRLPQQKAVTDGMPSGYAGKVSYYYPGAEISYGFDGKGINSHTNEPVSIYAKGAGYQKFMSFEGQWYPGTALLDNTHIHRVMLEVMGLVDENRN